MKVFKFAVDEKHARKNNELLRDTRRLQLSSFVFAILLIGAGALISWSLSAEMMSVIIFAIFLVVALVFVVVGLVVPKRVGDPQSLYDTYPLAPAIVAEVNPRDVVLLALVNKNIKAAEPPEWALCTRTCTNIGDHPRKVGTRVPVVAVGGSRKVSDQDHWDQITPMPIAWGTTDTEVINKALKSIPHEQWSKLEKHRGLFQELKSDPRALKSI